MTSEAFLVEFIDILQTDEEVTVDTMLESLEDWDSMSIMACQTWFDIKLGVKLTFTDFLDVKTLQDIINLSQGKIA